MRRLLAAFAVVMVAVAATPAFAGKPVSSYTITLTCPAGTYGYITNVTLSDSKGNVVSPAGYALECGTSPFGSVPQGFPSTTGLVYTSAKATQVSAGLWYCEDNRNSAGILGGTFFGGAAFAKGPKPTVASCPNVPDITLTIS
jgi:hypothetical protein